MLNIIKLQHIPSVNENTVIRQMERLLFPLKDRLAIIIDNIYQLKNLSPLLEKLNRSIIIICNMSIKEELLSVPENIRIIDFSQIKITQYKENARKYVYLLKPLGIITLNELDYKKEVWHELAQLHNIKNLNLNFYKETDIVSKINETFPYSTSFGNKINKLFIGCDKYLLEGWLNTDIREGGEIKYLDISSRLPFRNKDFKYVFIQDTIEYLEIEKCILALSEVYRILESGGRIRISILNFSFIFDIIFHPNKSNCKKYIKWLIQNNEIENIPNTKINDFKTAILNKWINKDKYTSFYDIGTIEFMLSKCGFKDISYFITGESLNPIFTNIEQQQYIYPMWINRLKYVSVEAVKL